MSLMRARPVRYSAWAIGLACCAAGCSTPRHLPNFGLLYNTLAQRDDATRNPVIVIPGILGSKLMDRPTGTVVWGAFAGGYADPSTPEGARLVALPMREGAALETLQDDVVPGGALDRVKLQIFGLPVELAAYVDILRSLGVGGYRDEQLGRAGAIHYGPGHFTCFQFDYDWRLDLVENVRRLDAFITEKRRYVRQELQRRYGIDREVTFDLVAHSMGGLLARYYLQYGAADLPSDGTSAPPVTWAGTRFVERAVLVGTPNGGSVDALLQLVEGFTPGPLLPHYAPGLLGTLPAVYELLPHPQTRAVVEAEHPEQAVDVLDPSLWERLGWGLAAPDQAEMLRWLLPDVTDEAARRRIALDHQRKCLQRARQLAAALDAEATPPPGVSLHLFAGDAVPTAAVASVDAQGRVRVLQQAPGDGLVTRASALLDQRSARVAGRHLQSPIRWDHVTFLFTDHLGLTKDPAFTDNILYLLLEQPN